MHSLRILLISPSSNRFYVPTAPLGLAYLAGHLPEEIEVEGLDLNVLKWVHGLSDDGLFHTFANYLEKRKQHGVLPGIIGLTVYQETLQQAIGLAEIASGYDVLMVAGGIYPTLFPDEMPFCFDYLIRGEGEEPFKELVQAIRNDWAIPSINGLSYQERAGDATPSWRHAGKPAIANRRRFPRRDIFNDLNMGFHYFTARMISSTGCPYACTFCVNSEYANRAWQGRPVQEVINEFQRLVSDPNISEVAFSDDQFLGCTPEDYDRAYRILEAIEPLTRSGRLRINLQVRADHFLRALEQIPPLEALMRRINENFKDPNPQTSQELHGRPVRGFSLDIGIESNIPHRLQRFAKGLSVETNGRAIAKAREMGLDLGIYMILFTPDLTLEELREEFAIYRRDYLDTDTSSPAGFFSFFNELIPYRGTRVYHEMKSDRDLVERTDEVGFYFRDLRVAAFYVLFLYTLIHNGFHQKPLAEMMAMIETMLCQSERLGVSKAAVLGEVICEMKKKDELERVYMLLKED